MRSILQSFPAVEVDRVRLLWAVGGRSLSTTSSVPKTAMSSANHHEDTRPIILLDGIWHNQNKIKYLQRLWKDVTVIHDDAFDCLYSPQLVSHVNRWGKSAEIIWLTRLDGSAKDIVAPALGLDDFAYLPLEDPLAAQVDPQQAQQTRKQKKAEKAEKAAKLSKKDCAAPLIKGTNRLVIWFDDKLKYSLTPVRCHKADSWQFNEIKPDPVLMRANTVYISPWCGIALKHVELVDRYLANPSLAEGRAIYELDMLAEHFQSEPWSRTKIVQVGEGKSAQIVSSSQS